MALASPGDTVAVRDGLFTVNSVELVHGVKLLGGWNASFTTRVPRSTHLMAIGPQALKCTTGQTTDTVIDGFEITGATASAILCDGSSATISDNEIHSNTGSDGGAVHCQFTASPIIENNHVHHNVATRFGGGLRAHFGPNNSPIIRNNLVEYNTARDGGGGIGVNNGAPLIEHNIVRFNTVTNGGNGTGGGIHVWYSEFGGASAEIRHNLIIYNSAPEGGGIGITAGHPIITWNTIWGNSAPEGGALYQEEGSFSNPLQTKVFNNILGGSPQGSAVYIVLDAGMDLQCNCIYANAGGEYDGIAPGSSDIYEDPQFCGIEFEDFTVRSSSPCLTGSCGQIGAYNAGCGPISVQEESWATIKAMYR